MEPAIYDAKIRHRRLEPAHEIHQRLRMAYLDLDEIPEAVATRKGWSTRPAPVWFRRKDYLDGTDRPMRDALGDLVEEQTSQRPTGPMCILTQLRTWGWLFNPLTTYYCFEPDRTTLRNVVLEVTNTPWHERFWYVLDSTEVTGRGTAFPKAFHVSPFLPMELRYQCRAPVPAERLALRFELSSVDSDGTVRRVFDADLTGRREALDTPLSPRSVALSVTQTMRVSAGIYAHAAILKGRGARFNGHPPKEGNQKCAH